MEWRFWARTRPAHFDASEDDCEAIEPLLSLYGDGMASPAEAQLVEAHLPGCESCRESLAWMQATRRALTGRPVLSPPADLHARIAEAIAASEAAPLRLRPARTFATRPAFAAAASLTVVGLFLGYSLTHLPRPVVSVKPVSPPIVAAVPTAAPPARVSPTKPPAPSVTIKKRQPAPMVADSQTGSEDTAPIIAPAPRVSAKNASRPSLSAPPTVAPRPRLTPVAPHSKNLVAVHSPTPVRTPAFKPLPAKAPVLTARNEPQGSVTESDVHVLPPKVTPQEPPATERTASATPGDPHVQTVDFIREIRAHLPSSETKFQHTVGMSLRGAARVTQTFGEEGKAVSIGNIHSPNF